jgi:penicillin-binding protein 1C
MAFDQGRIIPDSWLLDVPTDFSGYVAENYDERYRGVVTVRDALIQSLNASAVRLLAEIGLPEFHRLLLRGGLETLDRPAGHYGLPLILGAGEVRLVDLVNLYATLAQGGVHRPLQWIEPPHPGPHPLNKGEGERLFSPEAAGAVLRILTDVRRPDLPEAWDLTRGVPAVAWKTGTSYGHRDAWAVGASRRYTIGVWVGNFDGRPRQGISGSQHAGPLLFDLFRAIDPEGVAPAPAVSPEMIPETIEVCAVSHELPGPWCPARLRVPYLPGRSRLPLCSWHRRVLVDASTGELLAGDCLTRRRTAFRLLTVPPAELLAWWRSQGMSVDGPPPLAPACRGVPAGEPPRIVSPDPATAYRLRRDAPPEYQRIPLVARADSGASRLFWYQDGQLVAAMAPQESRFLDSVRGEHRLMVTDDLGRSDAVTYKVE